MFDVAARLGKPIISADGAAMIPSQGPCAAASSLAKRAFDLTFAGLVLLLFCPLFVAIVLAVRLETGEAALVTQNRTGYRGRVFTLFRFRTSVAADAMGGSALRETLVGRLLLALSLDELPQIWNVLKGDMSLVGPRPHEIADDAAFVGRIDRFAERFRVRPGLTGLAQVSGLRGEANALELMRDRIAVDNFYIENWSFGLDLTILGRTAMALREPRT